MQYYRLSKSLKFNQLIPVNEDVNDYITDYDTDWYLSVFKYNQEHYDQFQRTNSLAGSDGVVGNMIYFDFDSTDLDKSKADTQLLCERLIEDFGIQESDINLYFSGNKGFCVTLNINRELNPKVIKTICKNLAEGLETFDGKIYDNQRILRVPYTKHPVSGLRKLPLTLKELKNPIQEIKDREFDGDIKNPDGFVNFTQEFYDKFGTPKPPKSKLNLKVEANLDNPFPTIDWSKRLRFLTPEKYVLHCGYIEPGKRHDSLLILASTYKFLGYSKGDSYRLLKSVLEKQSEIYDQDQFSHDELWTNILKCVYADKWSGGLYGNDHPILQDIHEKLPKFLKIKSEQKSIVDSDSVFDKLDNFIDDIETSQIKTGIKTLDDDLLLLRGSSIGIVGVPGSGKTSWTLNILRNNSKLLNGENKACLMYSLDMNAPLIGIKQMQFIGGKSIKEVLSLKKENQKQYEKVVSQAKEDFKNVHFSFKYGLTPADIREDIIQFEEETGKKVVMIVVDYLESVQSGYQDPVTGAGIVAQQITNIGSDLDLTPFILLQTQKTGIPGQPISSMRNVKGSSVIEQSMSVILGIHREGQPSKYQDYDSTMGVTVLKNRFGQCKSYDLGWNGKYGLVTDITPDQKLELKELKELKKEEEEEKIRQKSFW